MTNDGWSHGWAERLRDNQYFTFGTTSENENASSIFSFLKLTGHFKIHGKPIDKLRFTRPVSVFELFWSRFGSK